MPAILLCLAALSGCDIFSPEPEPDNLSSVSAAVPTAWFELVYDLVQAERLSPPEASRVYGYTGVTLYEAVVPGMASYQSLSGQLSGLPALPKPGNAHHDWPTVANAALASVMRGLFAGKTSATLAAIDGLEERLAGESAASLSPETFQRSAAHGQAVAAAMLAWAQEDGYEEIKICSFTLPDEPGVWEPTAPAFAPPLLPCWGQVRSFVQMTTTCKAGPHPIYSEDPASTFFQEAKEVYDVGAALTDEQKEIARFWADNPGETGTPPGHSIAIVTQLMKDNNYSLGMAAEAYAKVGIAVADAFVACWETKYRYNLLRPITYIQQHISPGWTSFITTPPFPEYSSGHSVQVGATARVLTDMFGTVSFTDRTHVARGLAPRSFPSFSALAQEAAISRLYGGIHFRSAIEKGIDQGTCVGGHVSALKFRRRG